MTFEELGQTLRAEREKRRLTIYDAARELKMHARQIQALEEGNIADLPHQAYARGFIRSYASWLGIPKDEIQDLLASPASASAHASPPFAATREQRGKSKKSYFFIIFMLFLACALYWGWSYGGFDYLRNLKFSDLGSSSQLQTADEFMASKDSSKDAHKTAASIANDAASPSIAVPESAENKLGENRLSEDAAPNIQTADNSQADPKSVEEADLLQKTSSRAVSSSSPEEERGAVAAGSEEAGVSGQNKLIITATEECWVHSNADKTDTRQFSLRKGDTFALTFAKSLELKLGNAGGVRLRYNGEDLPPPGQSGQVKVLKFPPSAL